jgi:hypothetical protein
MRGDYVWDGDGGYIYLITMATLISMAGEDVPALGIVAEFALLIVLGDPLLGEIDTAGFATIDFDVDVAVALYPARRPLARPLGKRS